MQRSLKTFHRFAALLFLLAALLAPGYPAAAQQSPNPELVLLPEDPQLALGEELEIRLEIRDAVDLNAFDVMLSYDPDVLQVLDADSQEPGVQVEAGDFLSPDFVLFNTVDEDAGTIRFTMTQIAPSAPQSGDGLLLSFTVEGIASAAESPLHFLIGVIAQPNGTEIQPDFTATSVTVLGPGGTPPPTAVNSPTPTPTRTPTRTPLPPTNTPGGASPTSAATQAAGATNTAPPIAQAATATSQPSATSTEPGETPVGAQATQEDQEGSEEAPATGVPTEEPGPAATSTAAADAQVEESGPNAALLTGAGVAILALVAGGVYLLLKRRR